MSKNVVVISTTAGQSRVNSTNLVTPDLTWVDIITLSKNSSIKI